MKDKMKAFSKGNAPNNLVVFVQTLENILSINDFLVLKK